VPIWGQRLKRQLPAATYLELAPAGHCPHHEAPTAINSIIETYVAAVEAGQHTQHDLLQVRKGVGGFLCLEGVWGARVCVHSAGMMWALAGITLLCCCCAGWQVSDIVQCGSRW
jgi:hypothetical protein